MSKNYETIQEELGIARALSKGSRLETLNQVRKYLIKLALSREDGEVTCDDAYYWVRSQPDLEPLAQAAGALFKSPWWELSGRLVASTKPGSHQHLNPVWRIIPSKLK